MCGIFIEMGSRKEKKRNERERTLAGLRNEKKKKIKINKIKRNRLVCKMWNEKPPRAHHWRAAMLVVNRRREWRNRWLDGGFIAIVSVGHRVHRRLISPKLNTFKLSQFFFFSRVTNLNDYSSPTHTHTADDERAPRDRPLPPRSYLTITCDHLAERIIIIIIIIIIKRRL